MAYSRSKLSVYTTNDSRKEMANVRKIMKKASFLPSSALATATVAAHGVYVMQSTAKVYAAAGESAVRKPSPKSTLIVETMLSLAKKPEISAALFG